MGNAFPLAVTSFVNALYKPPWDPLRFVKESIWCEAMKSLQSRLAASGFRAMAHSSLMSVQENVLQ
jgi:hypothetical protein